MRNHWLLNIHAHTIFSDGYNSPLAMAEEAKRLGFSCLVLTDHFYGDRFSDVSLCKQNMHIYSKACREASGLLPVVRGIEIPFMGQEVLVFGGGVIKDIIENGLPTKEKMLQYRSENYIGIVLCHPGNYDDDIINYIDGYEHFNSGQNFFDNRSVGALFNKQVWCNSDAHNVSGMQRGYNKIYSKIEDEPSLIKYIKSQKKHDYIVRGEEVRL